MSNFLITNREFPQLSHSQRVNVVLDYIRMFNVFYSQNYCPMYSYKNHRPMQFNCKNPFYCSPVGWGCRMHRLHLCMVVGKTTPPRLSWIWHKPIWWWGSRNAEAFGNAEYSFIAIAPRSTLTRSGSTW